MDKYKKNQIKVGIVSIIGIAIFLIIVVIIKGINFNDNAVSVLFIFDNSYGITSGAPVVVNGVKRGTVDEVWNSDNKVYIKTTLNEISDLKEDVSAVISILEITGGKKIEILPGSSNTPYKSDKPIIGENSTDLPTVIRKVGDMTENITSIVIKLDTILTKTTRVLENENLNNNLQSIVKNISYSTEELAKIISNNNKNIDSAVKNLTQISSDLKIILKENKPQIDVIIKNLETAAIEINKIIPQIDTTINKTNKLLFDADGIVNEIKSNNGGTISKIIYDKEFAKQIDTLVQSLDGLVKQIKEHGINANIRLGGRP